MAHRSQSPPASQRECPSCSRPLRILSHYDFRQPLLISYLVRRSAALLGTFAPFNLRPTAYRPGYLTVQDTQRTAVEFFGNIAEESLLPLRTPGRAPCPR